MRATRSLGALARLLAGLVVAGAAAAHAASLGVSPIRVELSEAAPTTALTLENGSAEEMVVQLQLMRWEALGDQDRYAPSEDVVAMPPIATIPPGGTQIVRVGLTRPADAQRELAYRLYIEEVPPPPRPGFQGLRIALRVGVPIFVAPAAAAPALQWRVESGGGHAVAVAVTNTGTAHERLLRLTLRRPGDGGVLATQPAVGDLLPGQSRRWVVPVAAPLAGGRVRLSAETARGATDVELEVGHP